VLSTMLRIQETDGLKLQASVTDALDRAESLTALVSQFSGTASNAGAEKSEAEATKMATSFNPLDRA
jgi:hypothetical protein